MVGVDKDTFREPSEELACGMAADGVTENTEGNCTCIYVRVALCMWYDRGSDGQVLEN